jgi:maltose alpha-D-glucosyltransferase/alpha-amylase
MLNDLWYKNAIVYCLSVGTFMDANGDGVGDFQGLIRRLDYLQGLGATTIWLMPFQPSPGRDNGYDISDYYNVDPKYGTLGDFAEFSHACRERGLRVMIDLVVNHTSDQHAWFKEARSDPDSKYRDWYVWADKQPSNAKDGVVFPGVQKSTWTYDKLAKRWFFHRFYDFQPDLNTANPHVQAELLKVMGFWIQLGVSGFRMDAVPFVIATKGPKVRKPVEQYDMLRTFREFLQWRKGDAIILAEANVLPDTDLDYFGDDGERLQMMFNFQVNQNTFYTLATGDTGPLKKALTATKPRPATAQWGVFLRNHDELDLGRLTPDQRAAVFATFGPDPDMQLYERGIRRRLAPMLSGDRRRLELAYSLMLTSPGTPVFRYGDEIGMGDDLRLPERECTRTPMQWSTEPHGDVHSLETVCAEKCRK